MARLFKYLLFALAFAAATFTTNYAFAQTAGPKPSPLPTQTKNASGTVTPSARGISATIALTTPSSATLAATSTVTSTPGAVLLPTPTAAPALSAPSSPTSPLTVTTQTATDTIVEAGPLQGTILANRSESIARFFLEGETYQLTAGRSQGIALPRASTVLNLFNCAGDLAVDTAGCFWDPYLIQQDGFYEIYDSSATGEQAKLMLREAGAPPTGQVWVQNRTGQTESLVFKEDVYEIQPTSVLEFPVATGVPAILYVRSCLTIDNQSACEWAPKSLDAGVYYAMVEVDVPGSQTGSLQTTINLRPVVGESESSAEASTTTAATTTTAAAPSTSLLGPSIVCSVVVPALNVRSGPGLQYDIIGKVRTTDGTAVTVNVTGRSTDNEWLTVDPSVADNGWINNSPSFITCTGDLIGLPIAEAPASPTPQPAIVQAPITTDTTVGPQVESTVEAPVASEEQATPVEEIAPTEAVTTTDAAPVDTGIPPGQSMLVVNNGFQHEMRFTLDQMYRPIDGPSEFDIQPGGSLNIIVYPGDVPFTASSPWGGLSANATVHATADEAITLWLRFEAEQGGSWVFAYN